MLSKKMAVSLMSLITIFALAFAVMPAMAAKITLELYDGHYIAAHDNGAADGGTVGGVDDTDDDTANDGNDGAQTGDLSTVGGIQVAGGNVIAIKIASDEIFGNLADTDNVTGDFHTNAFDIITTGGTDPALSEVNSASRAADGMSYMLILGATNQPVAGTRVTVYLKKNTLPSIKTGTSTHEAVAITFEYVKSDNGAPTVISVERSDGAVHPVFEASVTYTLTLSEQIKGGKENFGTANLTVANADVMGVDFLDTTDSAETSAADDDYATPADALAGNKHTGNEYTGTGVDAANAYKGPLYRYSVTLKPKYEKTDDIKITVKQFEDQFGNKSADPALKEKAFKVSAAVVSLKPGTAGTDVAIPNDMIIPAGGYLVVVRDDEDGDTDEEKSSDSLIIYPGDSKATAISGRTLVKQKYNVVPVDLKYDLEGFLIRGGTIDLIAPDAGVMISEIMWATDGGETNRQWIEIHNTGSTQLKTKDYKLMLYTANEKPLDMAVAANKIVDRVSTLAKGTNHWPIVSKGKSGQTAGVIERSIGEGDDVDIDIEVVQTSELISMERVMAAGVYLDGTMDTSWAAAVPPSSNFMDAAGGLFVGSPGADPITRVADPVPEPEPEPTIPPDVATATDIVITEIMVDTGNGRLPQWIELANYSGKVVRLDGWSVEITNAAGDTDVADRVSIDLAGQTLDVREGENGTRGEALLLVAWGGRSSGNLSDRVLNVSSQLKKTGRYTLLSPMGFSIELLPPQTTGIVQFGDTAGNLGAKAAWDLPMSENGRSSLIRKFTAGVAEMGDDMTGWVLADATSLLRTPASWYGSDEDAGTPGVIGGGPLPVELSHFRPARDKATGVVVITWATQSELNNAGFFIKRAQQKDGEFKVVNPTMIAGAGTTSEKQFYTYTDTTAQPNVVYYYQIEDVSLDGNRQTLTRGIRLKGHIGAAGKLTSTWGELKSSNE